jgi:hypothetical protein
MCVQFIIWIYLIKSFVAVPVDFVTHMLVLDQDPHSSKQSQHCSTKFYEKWSSEQKCDLTVVWIKELRIASNQIVKVRFKKSCM